MAKTILEHFPKDDYQIYVEPFGGSAALLFAKPQSPIEIYNDLEHNVYCLFKVLADPEKYARLKWVLDLTPFSEQLRKEFKYDLRYSLLTDVQRAYRFLYVNRTSINGTGGLMMNTLVVRKICKPVSDYLSAVDRLPEIHQRLSNVVVLQRDALELLVKYDDPNNFFYLDPPYHWTTRTATRYKVEMGDAAQTKFIDILLGMKAKVLLSGYDNTEYLRLTAAGWTKHTFQVSMLSGTWEKKEQTECLWKNYE